LWGGESQAVEFRAGGALAHQPVAVLPWIALVLAVDIRLAVGRAIRWIDARFPVALDVRAGDIHALPLDALLAILAAHIGALIRAASRPCIAARAGARGAPWLPAAVAGARGACIPRSTAIAGTRVATLSGGSGCSGARGACIPRSTAIAGARITTLSGGSGCSGARGSSGARITAVAGTRVAALSGSSGCPGARGTAVAGASGAPGGGTCGAAVAGAGVRAPGPGAGSGCPSGGGGLGELFASAGQGQERTKEKRGKGEATHEVLSFARAVPRGRLLARSRLLALDSCGDAGITVRGQAERGAKCCEPRKDSTAAALVPGIEMGMGRAGLLCKPGPTRWAEVIVPFRQETSPPDPFSCTKRWNTGKSVGSLPLALQGEGGGG
jgi:hypothetical protein